MVKGKITVKNKIFNEYILGIDYIRAAVKKLQIAAGRIISLLALVTNLVCTFTLYVQIDYKYIELLLNCIKFDQSVKFCF